MKSLLLLTFLVVSSFLFGQKKLMASSNHYYDQSGQIYQSDSLAIHYGSWIGSLNQFKYEFLPGWNGVPDFQKSTPRIACDSTESFHANGAPLAPYFVSYNTLNADQIISTTWNWSTNTQSQTTHFTYNSAGNPQLIVTEYFDSGQYLYSDSTMYNYDALGNRINTLYAINSIGNLVIADTIEYIPGTNKIARFVQFSNTAILGSPLSKVFENFMHYTGNTIDYVDIWNTYASPTCEWNSRKKYLFNSSGVYEIQTFLLNGGVLASSPEFKTLINYDANGEPDVFSYFQFNAVMGRDSLEYDSDGFLTTIKAYNGSTLYLSKIESFYFQSTLSFTELEDKSFTLYPNPAEDFITIHSSGKLKDVEVYNMNGQLLIRQNTNEIDLSRLESGTYIIKGSTEKGSFQEKVSKL